MDRTFIAKAETTIRTSKAKVWDALVTPETIKQYMFGTNVVSGWREGGPIVWKGEWQGKAYGECSSTATSARSPGSPMCPKTTIG